MYSVVDIETTGGKSSSNRVTEIAIVKTDGKKIIETFSTLVNPHRKIDKFVVQLTGITDAMVANAPDFESIIEKIDEFTKDTIFVAHNIGFDYSIIKREYRNADKVFKRNNLCTVQLSRKILKNENSYSLGKLSDSLGIILENRHRALGDAEATAHLLHHLINTVGEENVLEQTAHKTQQIEFKGEITNDIIEELPEDPGVFRFLDKAGKVLYIGHSKNIFSTVTKFLIHEVKLNSYHGLFENMFSIDFEVRNSFLIAQLYAISEMIKHKPAFNKSSTYKDLPVGIFLKEEDLLNSPFYIENNHDFGNDKAIWRFTNGASAKRFLRKILKLKALTPPAFNGDKKIFDAEYKEKIERYLLTDLYPARNFFMVREVSYEKKAYVVWIEDFVYKGFGEIDMEFGDQSIQSLRDCIKFQRNNMQIQKLLKKYFAKAKGIQLLKY